MTVYSLQNVKVVDWNENDLFDSGDLILSSKNGRSIPIESKEAQETLKKLRAGSFQELKSLHFSSQYARAVEETEREVQSARPLEEQLLKSIQQTKDYAQASGISFDESWAADLQKRGLIQTFSFHTQLAAQRAEEGDSEGVWAHLQGIEELLSRSEIKGLVQWDPGMGRELQVTARRNGIQKNFLEAEKIAEQAFARSPWDPRPPRHLNEVIQVDHLLGTAEAWASRPEFSGESLFDQGRADKILKKVLERGFKKRMSDAQRGASRGDVEKVDEALREAEGYSRRPETRDFLRFDSQLAKALRKKALVAGFKVQMDFARGLTQGQYHNWSWDYESSQFLEKVENSLAKAEGYARRPETSGLIPWDISVANRVRKKAALFLCGQTLRIAERNSFIKYYKTGKGFIHLDRVQELLNSARGCSKRPEISSEIHWDEEKANEILKRALKNSFQVEMAGAAWAASRGFVFDLQSDYFKAAMSHSQHPLVAGEIQWDSEKAALLKKQAVEFGLKNELRSADRDFKLRRDKDYENDLRFIVDHLAVLPEFEQIHFKNLLKTMTREQVLVGFRIASHGARFAALGCNLKAMDNLLRLARACAEDPRVSSLLDPEGPRFRETIDHFLVLGVERLLNEVEEPTRERDLEETEKLLQQSREAWVRLGQPSSFKEDRWDQIRKDAFKKVIEKAFVAAERGAAAGKVDQVSEEIKKVDEYSRKAGLPFDERRYSRILEILEKKTH